MTSLQSAPPPVRSSDGTSADASTPHLTSSGHMDLAMAAIAGPVLIGVSLSQGAVGGAVGLLAAVGLVLALRRPVLIGYGVVLVVPITSGIARGLPIPMLRISEAAVLLAAALVLGRTAGHREYRWQALDWAAFAYVGLHAALGALGAAMHTDLSVEALQVLLGPLQFFLLYRVVRATIVTTRQRRVAVLIVVTASIPVSLLAIAQYLGAPGAQSLVETITRSEVFELWGYSSQNRATGPFESWHPLAGYLFLPIILCIASLGVPRRARLPAWLTILVLGMGALALVVSQTLNVVVGIAIAAVVIAMVSRRMKQVLVPLVVVGALAAVAVGPVIFARLDDQAVSDPTTDGFSTPQTISYRFEVWTDQYVPVLERYWIIGYGPDLPEEIEWRSTESLYLTLLVRGGVVLLGSYIVLTVVTFRLAWRERLSRDPTARLIALALLGAIIALIPMHAVFPYFTASGLPQVFWVLLALLIGPSRHDRTPDSGELRLAGRGPDGGSGPARGRWGRVDPAARADDRRIGFGTTTDRVPSPPAPR